MIDYPAMMQRKNKARSTTSVSSLSGHGSGYDTTNDDDDGNKKSDRGIGGGNNDDGGGGGGGGGGGRLRSSMIIANGNAVVVGGDAGGLLLELTSPATTTSKTTDISPPPPPAQPLTTTNKAGGGGGGGGGVAVVLSATVKRNKCGTRPFDARWLNLDCCGLVCAGVTYALHAYGLYAFCFVLLPPWLSETDEDGYREVSERGEVLDEVREEEMKGGREREILFFYFSSLFSLSLSSVSCYRRMCMPMFSFLSHACQCVYNVPPLTPLSRCIASSNRPHEQIERTNERTNE